MKTAFRWLLAILLLPIALAALLTGTQIGLGDAKERSFANAQDTLHDMRRMGAYAESVRAATGAPPETSQLKQWIAVNSFRSHTLNRYRGDGADSGGLGVAVLAAGESYILGEESRLPNDGHSYYIAYWNNRTNEYAPETGANTFPISVDDYAGPLWKRVLSFLLGLGLIVIIIRLVRPSTFRRSAS